MKMKVCGILAAVLIMVMFAGCGKPRPWYTITIKNNSGAHLEAVFLGCETFSCEIDNIAPGKVSDPKDCRSPLSEKADMLIIKKGGAKPATQKIDLKSKVGKDVDSATIEFVINPDNSITINSTPRPLPEE